MGRPTDYKPSYCKQAEKLCKLGATDKQLADFFGTSEKTLNTWKSKYPKFLQSLKEGKSYADAEVVESLYQRAKGYVHDSEEIKVVSDGMSMGSSVVRVPVKKIYPPDPVSCIFWLKNRQPKLWRDKVETGFTDSEGNDVAVQVYIPDNGRSKNHTAAERLPGESTE